MLTCLDLCCAAGQVRGVAGRGVAAADRTYQCNAALLGADEYFGWKCKQGDICMTCVQFEKVLRWRSYMLVLPVSP